jgi:hypothetical protein
VCQLGWQGVDRLKQLVEMAAILPQPTIFFDRFGEGDRAKSGTAFLKTIFELIHACPGRISIALGETMFQLS